MIHTMWTCMETQAGTQLAPCAEHPHAISRARCPAAEVLTVRILAVRNAAPTRRLQGDSSASVVVVDASLSVDTPRNPESGQAATTSVVDNLLLVRQGRGWVSNLPSQAGCAWSEESPPCGT